MKIKIVSFTQGVTNRDLPSYYVDVQVFDDSGVELGVCTLRLEEEGSEGLSFEVDQRPSYPIRDGKVFEGQQVWAKTSTGPESRMASGVWLTDLQANPNNYSLAKPVIASVTYVDEVVQEAVQEETTEQEEKE